jgi:TonB family protein
MDYDLYYPDHALERGLEGTATLFVLINENGSVEQVELQRSSGYALLDSAALQTAQTFQFSPAMLYDKPVKASVLIPVNFKLREIDLDTWITEVRVLQARIAREMKDQDIAMLYSLYKRLVYSTRFDYDLDLNDYIKTAVLKSTAGIWDGYWSLYPAASLLFIDIIKRYPDSFMSLQAEADFNKYLEAEAIRIHHRIPDDKPYTLINSLYGAIENE